MTRVFSALTWPRVRELLLPGREDRDKEFCEEVASLSVTGLRTVASVCLGVPALLWVSRLGFHAETLIQPWLGASVMAVGLAAAGMSFVPSARDSARLLSCLIGYVVAAMVIVSSLSASWDFAGVEHYIPGNMTLVMLVAVAALPLKPLHTLMLGLSISATYTVLLVEAPSVGIPAHFRLADLILMVTVVMVCTALTTLIYFQRRAAYDARKQVVRSLEELQVAQAQLLIAENATSQGRLAATLSHELNSPIGALNSILETLPRILRQQQENPREAVKRIGRVSDMVRTAQESCRRLTEIINRMQRFTNLDGAAIRWIDLNELLSTTVSLLESELRKKAEIKLHLQSIPPVKCRPHQLNLVFLNLLRNAAAAIEDRGRILVNSEQREAEIVITVQDTGKGIPSGRLPHLFEPEFAIKGGRVSTSNWGLFGSRSVIVQHGGRIDIDSTEGKGTSVTVVFPANQVQEMSQDGFPPHWHHSQTSGLRACHDLG